MVHPQISHLQRVQAGTLELLRGRDAQLAQLRMQSSDAATAHAGRRKVLQGMQAAMKEAAAGAVPLKSTPMVLIFNDAVHTVT